MSEQNVVPEISTAQAADAVHGLLRVYRALEHGEQILAKLASAEQATVEAETARDKILSELDGAQADFDAIDANALRAELEAERERIITTAQAQAVVIVQQAEESAAHVQLRLDALRENLADEIDAALRRRG